MFIYIIIKYTYFLVINLSLYIYIYNRIKDLDGIKDLEGILINDILDSVKTIGYKNSKFSQNIIINYTPNNNLENDNIMNSILDNNSSSLSSWLTETQVLIKIYY